MITIYNATKDNFIQQSADAFAFINGSSVKTSKVRQALAMQFGLKNEHLIDSLFTGPATLTDTTEQPSTQRKETVSELESQTLFAAMHDDTETYEDEIAAYRRLCSALVNKLNRAELDELLTDTFDLDGDDADFYFENGNKVKNFVLHSPVKPKASEQPDEINNETPVMCTFEEDDSDLTVTFDAHLYFYELLQQSKGMGHAQNIAKSASSLSDCVSKLRDCSFTADYATDDIAYWAEMHYGKDSAIRQAVFKSNGFCLTVEEKDLEFWLAIHAPELVES